MEPRLNNIEKTAKRRPILIVQAPCRRSKGICWKSDNHWAVCCKPVYVTYATLDLISWFSLKCIKTNVQNACRLHWRSQRVWLGLFCPSLAILKSKIEFLMYDFVSFPVLSSFCILLYTRAIVICIKLLLSYILAQLVIVHTYTAVYLHRM